MLRKTYFSGGILFEIYLFSALIVMNAVEIIAYVVSNLLTGTVAASIADIDFVKRRESVEELFEDGTTSFLSIASIRHGFKLLNSLTATAISQ